MLLDHVSLLAIKAASDSKDDILQHLHAEAGRVLASNGAILVRVDPPIAQPDMFFPQVPEAVESKKPVVIPAIVAEAALKLIGKDAGKLHGLCLVGHDAEGRCVVANAGAEDRPVVQSAAQPEGFPDLTKSLPKGKPDFEVTIDIDLLKLVASISKASTGHSGLRLMFYGEGKPIAFRSAYPKGPCRVSGVVMPMAEPAVDDDDE